MIKPGNFHVQLEQDLPDGPAFAVRRVRDNRLMYWSVELEDVRRYAQTHDDSGVDRIAWRNASPAKRCLVAALAALPFVLLALGGVLKFLGWSP